jgi:hypothetical protein
VPGLTVPPPSPGDITPPAISSDGAVGLQSTAYARADHTHPSKLRRAKIVTAADGTVTWTFSPPFDVGVVPCVLAIAETATGVTDVVNVQLEGVPTNTQAVLRVNRTQRSVVALIGLTVLSVPAGSVGATTIHAAAFAP